MRLFKEKEVRVAKSALDLSKNEAFQEAMKALEQQYITLWKESHISDDDGRDKLYLAINVLGKIQHHLQIFIDDGKVHEAEKAIKKDFK